MLFRIDEISIADHFTGSRQTAHDVAASQVRAINSDRTADYQHQVVCGGTSQKEPGVLGIANHQACTNQLVKNLLRQAGIPESRDRLTRLKIICTHQRKLRKKI